MPLLKPMSMRRWKRPSLAPQGVIVNIVEPGNFDSAIDASATKRTGVTTTFTDRSNDTLVKMLDEALAPK
jgi:hypothetical protein